VSEENKEKAVEEKKVQKKTIMKLFKVFNFMKKEKKKEAEEIEETPKKRRSTSEDEEPEEKIKINIPFKEIATVFGLALVLSIFLVFIFDLTGWRSSLRNNITTKLLGMEKQVLIEQYEYEYQTKLEAETSNLLVEERANLVVEYEQLDVDKQLLDKREKEILKKEKELQTQIEQFDIEKEQLQNQIKDFEQSKVEISDLSKIYSTMEPKNAAAILIAMTDEQLMLQILAAMKSTNLASILEQMEATKAAEIIGNLG